MTRFGVVADELIRLAVIDQTLKRKLTKEQRLLLELRDGGWHDGRELALRVSHRFGGYLHTLKTRGVAWEKRQSAAAPKGESWWEYRLVPLRDDGQTGLF